MGADTKILESVKCTFSLLDEGRKYSGQHRKYLIENAREMCYAPETRERIKNREALGYYGHNGRVYAGKMHIQEMEIVPLPDGTKTVIYNVPSNVTTQFDIAEDGTVTHTQDILETKPGQVVSSLNASHIGGFSWACNGTDGGSTRPSNLKGFEGFDYVLTPGFTLNRGYVLESAQKQNILESISAILGQDQNAQEVFAGWQSDAEQSIKDLQFAVWENEAKYIDLKKQNANLQNQFAALTAEKQHIITESAALRNHFRDALGVLTDKLPFFIPESAMQAMLDGDFDRAKMLFETASHYDFSQLPIWKHDENAPAEKKSQQVKQQKPDFGTAEYGLTLNL